jgi:hypothetical protein
MGRSNYGAQGTLSASGIKWTVSLRDTTITVTASGSPDSTSMYWTPNDAYTAYTHLVTALTNVSE